MKASVALKQSQQLKMSPQLQQSIRLLQMSTLEVEREIESLLQSNPLLEKVEQSEAFESQRLSAAIGGQGRVSDENDWDSLAQRTDFYQFLHEQAAEHGLSEEIAGGVHWLIEHLDEHGYLTESLEDMCANAPLAWRLSEAQLGLALKALQRFDPAGVGARNLRESLWLQLQRVENQPLVQPVACAIVQAHFDKLGRFQAASDLKKALGLPESLISDALLLIKSLNPLPTNGLDSQEPTAVIEPDVWVRETAKGLSVARNEAAFPKVRINPDYASWLSLDDAPDIQEQVKEAQQWVQALAIREDTVLRLAEYIVREQAEFFTLGPKALRPMMMQEAAAALNVHESTISRSCQQKYLYWRGDVLELRYFFLHAASSDTQDSAVAVKAYLQEWIRAEDKAQPLSDEALAELLAQRGMRIARRTVAKYREQMGLASAHRRRDLSLRQP